MAAVAHGAEWQPYPGNFDMGGWSIVRNSQGQVALLGPPNHQVVVGPDDGQMVGFLFTPRFIITRQQGSSGAERYFVIERGWKDQSTPHTAEQLIIKKSGPLTRAELDAGADWQDELGMLPYMNAPRAPPQAIFWKKPFIVIFYSLVVLGGPILIILVPLVVVGFLIVRMLRRRRTGRPTET
jgi:hypothetical protein